MGSMLEIMKKVRDENGPATPPEVVEGIVEPLLDDEARPAAAPSRFAESAQAAGAKTSSFTAVEYAAAPARVDFPDTQDWDPKLIDPAVVAFHARYSAECEQFRSIRARLLSMNGTANHLVLAITSSAPREGKSICALNLGLVMAEGGERRTLIVDADLRHSSISRMLGLEQSSGLTNVIRGISSIEESLCPTPLPNLKVLPAGARSEAGFSDLLNTQRLSQVFADLRNAFDYVFVDMPAVNTVADASVLGPQCDAALLVVEMQRTPEPLAQQAVRTLQANNVRIVGCIVTRHDDRRLHNHDINDDHYRRL
jgi:capsular exopolysaccharide synthesis family protein